MFGNYSFSGTCRGSNKHVLAAFQRRYCFALERVESELVVESGFQTVASFGSVDEDSLPLFFLRTSNRPITTAIS